MWQTAPLHAVVVACWLLDDEERRDRLVQEGRALDAAILTNYAVNDAKRLDAERRRYDARLMLAPAGSDTPQHVLDAREQMRQAGRLPS